MPNNRNNNLNNNFRNRRNRNNNLVIRNIKGKTNNALKTFTLLYSGLIVIGSIIMLILGNEHWSKSSINNEGKRVFTRYDFKELDDSARVIYPDENNSPFVLNDTIKQLKNDLNNAEKLVDNINLENISSLEKEIEELKNNILAGKANNTNLPETKKMKEEELQNLVKQLDDLSNNRNNIKKKYMDAINLRDSNKNKNFNKFKSSITLRNYNVLFSVILGIHLVFVLLISSNL